MSDIEPEVLEIAKLLDSLIKKRVSENKESKSARDEELTVREAALLKRVSPRTVYAWIEQKQVAVKKTPGGGIRILRSELDKAA